MSISYSDMTDDIDAIPVIDKNESNSNYNINYLIRIEVFHTGY